MTHGSLFSGIGGFDLAAEWAGWENLFHCEWNEFGRRVLKHHFPKSKSYGDIKKTDFTIWRGKIDVLTGGFPCQPYSHAGKRLGKEDDRHLWPEMLRAIREVRPRWIVGENVRGIVNWSGGVVFEEVHTDLETEGYEVQAFILPACGVDAPHRRDRVWFVAHSDLNNDRRTPGQNAGESREERVQKRNEVREPTESSEVFGASSDPNGGLGDQSHEKLQPRGNTPDQKNTGIQTEKLPYADSNGGKRKKPRERNATRVGREREQIQRDGFRHFPTQPPICGGDDELPRELDGITFSKWRNESIKAYGNAIVPQVAYQIFKSINEYEKQ